MKLASIAEVQPILSKETVLPLSAMPERTKDSPQSKGLSCFYEALWSKQEQALHFSPLPDGGNLHAVGYIDVKLVHIGSLTDMPTRHPLILATTRQGRPVCPSNLTG